jgi:hypothetical protein
MNSNNQSNQEIDLNLIGDIIREVKIYARKYYELTGRPLGITGEIAEFEAANLLGLRLSVVRTPGYDATIQRDGKTIKYQIKGRCVLNGSKPSQRVGSIRLSHEWDAVLLVLLDKDFEPLEILEAQRPKIENELKTPGSKARNERGALSVSKFRQIAQPVWKRNK